MRGLAGFAAAWFGMFLLHAPPVDAEDVPTIESYRQIVMRQRAQLRQLYIQFEISNTWDDAVQAAGVLDNLVLDMRTTLAFRDGQRYCKSAGYGPPPARRRAVDHAAVYTGNECRIREGRTLVIQQEKSGYTEMNAYTSLLRWPFTSDERARLSQAEPDAYFIPNCIDGRWRFRPQRELADGVRCAVLEREDGESRFWLDGARGWALVRAEQQNQSPEVGQVTVRYSDHSEVLPDVFLPRRITTEEVRRDPRSGDRIGAFRSDLKVSALSAVDVPQHLFVLEPLAGEFVMDEIQRTRYYFQPTGEATIDESIADVRRAFQDTVALEGRGPVLLWGMGVSGALLLQAILTFAYFRRTGRR